MLKVINPHTARMLIAYARPSSIASAARRSGTSYGWVWHWTKELEKLRALRLTEGEYVIRRSDPFYKNLARAVGHVLRISPADLYRLPSIAGVRYAYTKTDAVFLWTKGGYNVGRSKESYPMFMRLAETDLTAWESILRDLGIPSVRSLSEEVSGRYFVVEVEESIVSEETAGLSVDPLAETVRWAEENIHDFLPALELLSDMYDLGLEHRYAEVAPLA